MDESHQHRSSAPRWGIEHLLFEMEQDGVLAWMGEYRNGRKVYVTTDAGLYAFDKREAKRRTGDICEIESDADNRRFLRAAVKEYLNESRG